MSQSISLYSGSPELVQVHVSVLELGEAGHFGIPDATNKLKPNNYAAQHRRSGIRAVFGTFPNVWRLAA